MLNFLKNSFFVLILYIPYRILVKFSNVTFSDKKLIWPRVSWQLGTVYSTVLTKKMYPTEASFNIIFLLVKESKNKTR